MITDPDVVPDDTLPRFRAALTPHAAAMLRALPADAVARWVTAAVRGGRTPEDLAKHVGGIDHGLILTPSRMQQRLRNAAGDTDKETNE